MSLCQQLRWGGLWIIVAALVWSGTNIIIYTGKTNAAIQAVHGVGYTGLILAITFIHITQAWRAGIFELFTYLLCVLCLVYLNVSTFVGLGELTGLEGAKEALDALLDSMIPALYAIFFGLILLGLATAQTGVFPRWGGILIALGTALLLPAQFVKDLASPMFYIFTIGGSAVVGAGMIWLGWALWSGKGLLDEQPRLSNLDRMWGAPFVVLTAFLLTANAYINTFAGMTLMGAIVNVAAYTALILAIVILYTAQADRAGGLGLAGFFFTHLGATLFFIPAYLIMVQLAGLLNSNRALMIVWNDVPVGKIGNYMIPLGLFLFGISVIRAEVFPRWTGWLIVIGVALLMPTQFQSQAYLFQIFWVIGATLVGIGMGWMGWKLMMNKSLVEQEGIETNL